MIDTPDGSPLTPAVDPLAHPDVQAALESREVPVLMRLFREAVDAGVLLAAAGRRTTDLREVAARCTAGLEGAGVVRFRTMDGAHDLVRAAFIAAAEVGFLARVAYALNAAGLPVPAAAPSGYEYATVPPEPAWLSRQAAFHVESLAVGLTLANDLSDPALHSALNAPTLTDTADSAASGETADADPLRGADAATAQREAIVHRSGYLEDDHGQYQVLAVPTEEGWSILRRPVGSDAVEPVTAPYPPRVHEILQGWGILPLQAP